MCDHNNSPDLDMTSLGVTVGDLRLTTPLVVASGIWPYESSMWGKYHTAFLGGICSKAITAEPRRGNDGVRIWETPSGMLNSIGLQNEGVESFIENKLETLASHGVPLVLNVSMENAQDLEAVLRRLGARKDLIGCIELNVSCPNVDCGGMSWGVRPDLTEQATNLARRFWDGPLWVKLTPQAADLCGVAKAAENGGANALVVGNTWLGMAIDVKKARPVFNRRVAGLSGPAVFPLALRTVWDVCSAVDIPVVGCGGVATAEDVMAMMMAGASAVQIGVSLFTDLEAPERICRGLLEGMALHKVKSVSEFVGLAR